MISYNPSDTLPASQFQYPDRPAESKGHSQLFGQWIKHLKDKTPGIFDHMTAGEIREDMYRAGWTLKEVLRYYREHLEQRKN